MNESLPEAGGQDVVGSDHASLPPPSKAAVGCLVVPAGMGGCMLMLFGIAALAWVINRLIGEGTVLGIPMRVQSFPDMLPGLAWFLPCILALRAILGGVRKRWVYWLTVLCLAFGVVMMVFTLVINTSVFGDDYETWVIEWALFLWSVSILVWFSLSLRNWRYYRP